MTSLYEQILLIFHYLLIGFFFGISYDSLDIVLEKKRLLVKYLIEAIFWIIIISIITIYIIKNVNGYIRLYSILFFILGVVLYYLLLAKKHQTRMRILCYFWKKKITPIIVLIIYPKEVVHLIKKIFKRKQKNEKNNNTSSPINNEYGID